MPPPKCKAPNTCRRNDSRWHGETEGMGGVVNVTPGCIRRLRGRFLQRGRRERI